MVIACLLLLAAAAQPEISVDPRPGSFVGPSPAPGLQAASGPFRGSLALYGSAAEMPLSGRAETSQGRLRVTATPSLRRRSRRLAHRFRPDAFDYRVRVEVPGRRPCPGPAPSAGTGSASSEPETLEQFVKLASLELTALALTRSEGRGLLVVTNPFLFDHAGLDELSPLDRRRRGGGGGTRGRILRPQHKVSLELPFTVQHWRFIGAAGGQWAAGADIEAELEGSLTSASFGRPVHPSEVSRASRNRWRAGRRLLSPRRGDRSGSALKSLS
jgi:hypothetical protein